MSQLLPQAVAVVNDGPLWVSGGVPVTTSDGVTVVEVPQPGDVVPLRGVGTTNHCATVRTRTPASKNRSDSLNWTGRATVEHHMTSWLPLPPSPDPLL